MNSFLKCLIFVTISALFLLNSVVAKEDSIRNLETTKAPVKTTTKAPNKATTKAPIKAVTKFPTVARTKNPIKAPVKTPIKVNASRAPVVPRHQNSD